MVSAWLHTHGVVLHVNKVGDESHGKGVAPDSPVRVDGPENPCVDAAHAGREVHFALSVHDRILDIVEGNMSSVIPVVPLASSLVAGNVRIAVPVLVNFESSSRMDPV